MDDLTENPRQKRSSVIVRALVVLSIATTPLRLTCFPLGRLLPSTRLLPWVKTPVIVTELVPVTANGFDIKTLALPTDRSPPTALSRSEEHTSEL